MFQDSEPEASGSRPGGVPLIAANEMPQLEIDGKSDSDVPEFIAVGANTLHFMSCCQGRRIESCSNISVRAVTKTLDQNRGHDAVVRVHAEELSEG